MKKPWTLETEMRNSSRFLHSVDWLSPSFIWRTMNDWCGMMIHKTETVTDASPSVWQSQGKIRSMLVTDPLQIHPAMSETSLLEAELVTIRVSMCQQQMSFFYFLSLWGKIHCPSCDSQARYESQPAAMRFTFWLSHNLNHWQPLEHYNPATIYLLQGPGGKPEPLTQIIYMCMNKAIWDNSYMSMCSL